MQSNTEPGRQAPKRYHAWTSEQALALIADHAREFEGWIIEALQRLGVATVDEILDDIYSTIEQPSGSEIVLRLSRENFILRRRTRVYHAHVCRLIEIADEDGESYAGNPARRYRLAPWDHARGEFQRRRFRKQQRDDVRRLVG